MRFLKTLAKPLEGFDSGVWATSPADGDIETFCIGGPVSQGGSQSVILFIKNMFVMDHRESFVEG